MTHETTEQLKQSIRKLEEQLDEVRAKRVAKGLPPDPPPRFVSLPMAWTIYHRLSPLIKYAVQYANICDQTNEIIEISDEQMKWIKSHEVDIFLVNNARKDMGLLALGIEGIYTKLTNYNKFETAGELLRDLVQCIRLTRPEYGKEHRIDDILYDHRLSSEENTKAYREANAELKRLEDEEYFRKEYDKLIEHYESIKEEIK